jgi:hypothetical protein
VGRFFGLAAIAAAALLLEIAWTRVFSVSLWYHFGFLVLGTAMLGLALAGPLWAGLRRYSSLLPNTALVLPLILLGSHAAMQQLPFEPFSLAVEPGQWLLGLALIAFSSLPFLGVGLLTVGLFSSSTQRAHELYLADLLGAASGAGLSVWAINAVGAPGAVFLAAALASAGALALLWSRRMDRAIAALILLATLFAMPWAESLIPLRISRDKTIEGVAVSDLLAQPGVLLESRWSELARVDLIEIVLRDGQRQRLILFDGGAALTRVAQPLAQIDELPPATDEISFFFSRVEFGGRGQVPNGQELGGTGQEPNLQKTSTLILGSGGGFEALLALRAGVEEVHAVEINPAVNQLLREDRGNFSRGLAQHPRLHLHTAEARAFLSRCQRSFDVIVSPHTISNAAMLSGALNLSENRLLTLEGLQAQLDHLSDRGLLLITHPEAHLPRLLRTIERAESSAGRPPLHTRSLLWRGLSRDGEPSFYAGLAVSRRDFGRAEVEAFALLARQLHLELLYAPGGLGVDPNYEAILDGRPDDELRFDFPVILEPATDDRPFFNQRVALAALSWGQLVELFSQGTQSRGALENRPVAELALMLLLLETAVVALILLFLPLLRRRKGPRQFGLNRATSFGALGLGYMSIELGAVQTLGLLLESPTMAFAVVLAAMLAASGLGSFASRRFSLERLQWPLLAAFVAALAVALGLGSLAAWALPMGLAARVLLSVLALAIPAFFMGMPFPLMLRAVAQREAADVPWAWACNAVFSVSGGILSVLLGMTVGFAPLLLLGAACYAFAWLLRLAERVAPGGESVGVP